ncbi:MAG TPA: putative sugar nucleotidyl transferase [Spirochaetota bacterium]|nr:putative sugar nucleotidyl transferase [Spirochaetota bacterium]
MQKSPERIVVTNYGQNKYNPISQTRPVWDILCGCLYAFERIKILCDNKYPGIDLVFLCSRDMLNFCKEKHPSLDIVDTIADGKATLFLNPFLYDIDFIDMEIQNCVYLNGNTFLAAYTDSANSLRFSPDATDNRLDIVESEIIVPDYIWDMVNQNGFYIHNDISLLKKKNSVTVDYDSLTIVGSSENLYIDNEAVIDPFVVIDTRKGPVYISGGVTINSFTRVEGPCYLAPGVILYGAKIREGCSIGEGCRIGGEVEDSVFHPWSNKYHDGFIGHACIGEWVNLGALTTNSDLKNNYSSVAVYQNGNIINTGLVKVGCFIGDHTKMSIGSLINTGASIGCFSMSVHSGRMTPQFIPSFSIFIKNGLRDIKSVETLLDSTEIVMNRRNKSMSNAFKEYIINLYKNNERERVLGLDRWNKSVI